MSHGLLKHPVLPFNFLTFYLRMEHVLDAHWAQVQYSTEYILSAHGIMGALKIACYLVNVILAS